MPTRSLNGFGAEESRSNWKGGGMLKKFRRPPIDLDQMNLTVIPIDELEANEMRGIPFEAPISERAVKISIVLKKKGRTFTVTAPSLMVCETTKRLLSDELERIVRNSNKTLRCVQKGTTLTFSYVDRFNEKEKYAAP
jgi:hypothetical protein